MHVAVTGASSGIGEAIAREFARAGAKLTLVARRRDRLERIASELGVPSFVAVQDLADPVHAADWIPQAEEALGPIDILISNAGFLTLGPVATFDPEASACSTSTSSPPRGIIASRERREALPATETQAEGKCVRS